MAELKEALKGDDADAIQAKTKALAQASMKLGEAMYKAQQAGGERRRRRRPPAATAAKKDDVVDAEFEEVDDDKKNVGLTSACRSDGCDDATAPSIGGPSARCRMAADARARVCDVSGRLSVGCR